MSRIDEVGQRERAETSDGDFRNTPFSNPALDRYENFGWLIQKKAARAMPPTAIALLPFSARTTVESSAENSITAGAI